MQLYLQRPELRLPLPDVLLCGQATASSVCAVSLLCTGPTFIGVLGGQVGKQVWAELGVSVLIKVACPPHPVSEHLRPTSVSRVFCTDPGVFAGETLPGLAGHCFVLGHFRWILGFRSCDPDCMAHAPGHDQWELCMTAGGMLETLPALKYPLPLQLDSLIHRFIILLTDTSDSRASENRVTDANMACRKLAVAHPILLLRCWLGDRGGNVVETVWASQGHPQPVGCVQPSLNNLVMETSYLPGPGVWLGTPGWDFWPCSHPLDAAPWLGICPCWRRSCTAAHT